MIKAALILSCVALVCLICSAYFNRRVEYKNFVGPLVFDLQNDAILNFDANYSEKVDYIIFADAQSLPKNAYCWFGIFFFPQEPCRNNEVIFDIDWRLTGKNGIDEGRSRFDSKNGMFGSYPRKRYGILIGSSVVQKGNHYNLFLHSNTDLSRLKDANLQIEIYGHPRTKEMPMLMSAVFKVFGFLLSGVTLVFFLISAKR